MTEVLQSIVHDIAISCVECGLIFNIPGTQKRKLGGTLQYIHFNVSHSDHVVIVAENGHVGQN